MSHVPTQSSDSAATAPNSRWKVWLLAAILMAVDFSLGPSIQFGLFFVVPVIIAAWYHGMWWALGLAVLMAATRILFHWVWDFPTTLMTALINNSLRVATLALVAFATAHVAEHVRQLRRRITMLEARLPICRSCGVIQDDRGDWVPLAAVPAPAILPICPRCDEKSYGINS